MDESPELKLERLVRLIQIEANSITKSAKATGEFEEWINNNFKMHDMWEDLRIAYVREQKLVRALLKYADPKNYEPQDYKGLHYIKPIGDDHSPLSDRGKWARDALKDLGYEHG